MKNLVLFMENKHNEDILTQRICYISEKKINKKVKGDYFYFFVTNIYFLKN